MNNFLYNLSFPIPMVFGAIKNAYENVKGFFDPYFSLPPELRTFTDGAIVNYAIQGLAQVGDLFLNPSGHPTVTGDIGQLLGPPIGALASLRAASEIDNNFVRGFARLALASVVGLEYSNSSLSSPTTTNSSIIIPNLVSDIQALERNYKWISD